MKDQEKGNVTILALASMIALAIAMMLALEFACLFVQKATLDNDLNIAREETLSAGFDMQLKNSPEPGKLIATTIADSLKRNNFNGDVTIWFYEATDVEITQRSPQLSTVDNVRALSYYTALSQEYHSTIVPSSWLEGIAIRSDATATMCPYALYKTYKPSEGVGVLVKYQFRNGRLSDTSEQAIESAPEKLSKAIEDSIKKASETAASNL